MMTRRHNIINLDEAAWNAFVRSHQLGTVYHHSAWHRVMETTYGFTSRYYLKLGPDDRIQAAIAAAQVKDILGGTRIVSYPFSDSCDPLVRDGSEFDELMNTIEEVKKERRIKSIEIRGYRLHEITGCERDHDYCNFVLPLSQGQDSLFKSFHRDCVQRGIKKAERSRVEVAKGASPEDMIEFYRLHVMTRKKHGVPVQPLRFFKNLWDILYHKGMLEVFLARKDGSCAAGIILLKFKDTAYYKYGASDPWYLNTGANQLLMWSAIKEASAAGLSLFDFGRTYTGNAGLMEYKSRWGAEQVPMGYVYRPAKPRVNSEGSASNRFVSGMLKRMPAFSVRVMGELFYKYLA